MIREESCSGSQNVSLIINSLIYKAEDDDYDDDDDDDDGDPMKFC